ncbi:olfactory receptor 502-like [Ornithorhynchus anatinus]|nr:olfactory receptor 502-like [Ornithorhynchus anatinus]
MCISSTATPKLLENSLMGKTSISYMECAVQFFIASIFGPAECLLLAAMAYDRYVAICKPLAYPAIMSKRFCLLMVVDSYLGSLLTAFVFTSNLFRLSFCGPNVINHFFCDFPPLLKLSCSDTTLAKIIPSSFATLLILSTLAIIVVSYLYIMLAILRIKSSAGRGKAFSTCASHLTAVSLFYGSSAFIYMLPKSKYSMDQKKVVSMFYMVVIPMLNPLIYTLRNKEVKEALKRTLGIKGIYYGQF